MAATSFARRSAAALFSMILAGAATAAVTVTYSGTPTGVVPMGAVIASSGVTMTAIPAGYAGPNLFRVRPPLLAPPPGINGNYVQVTAAGIAFVIPSVVAASGAPPVVADIRYQAVAPGVKIRINGVSLALPGDFAALVPGTVIGGMQVSASGPNQLVLTSVAGAPLTQLEIAGQDLRLDNIFFN